jgi:hypothetical protein
MKAIELIETTAAILSNCPATAGVPAGIEMPRRRWFTITSAISSTVRSVRRKALREFRLAAGYR